MVRDSAAAAGVLHQWPSFKLQSNNDMGNEVVETERQAFGSSEEVESRVEVTTVINANNLLQQPLAPVVNWERYLPFRSLKVLLVENDDSTRHIVTALLKNCSYEVTAVPDVLEAWRILEDENMCIDLVLTEVVMPVNSGAGLLCKIMSHKTHKNIPVIMMSSHDSMALVFKCLSNGAVDFLVKPIRKNELKNLWQHVWRRCHSSSGSGSESGVQNKKSVKDESTEGSDNNASMSDEDHRCNGGSDNGSGTQSSWTKRAHGINSTSPSYQLPEEPNMHKKAEEPGDLERDAKYSVKALRRNKDDNGSSVNSQVQSKTPSPNTENLQSLELTLTKPSEAGDDRVNGRSVLRHSYHSAFSKYNNNGATSANKGPEENVGSCSPGDSSVAKIMGSGLSSDNPSSGSERATQREAALMKFRLKRKERCFEKKVRYHSRKKLAEQRPRVKGQFIRKRDDSK